MRSAVTQIAELGIVALEGRPLVGGVSDYRLDLSEQFVAETPCAEAFQERARPRAKERFRGGSQGVEPPALARDRAELGVSYLGILAASGSAMKSWSLVDADADADAEILASQMATAAVTLGAEAS